MGFFRFFGIENVNFQFSTERLGIAIFCALITIGSTFAPIINLPHIVLEGYPTDMSNSRLFMLFIEVLGIVFNLIGLRSWAAMLFLGTIVTLILDFIGAIEVTDSINQMMAKDPTIHYTQHAGLAWGWWLLVLGPLIMGGVLLRDIAIEGI